ncbi:MAG TPA: hypothetical protein VF139_04405 [Candidatus Polarisedimenticolaceae bacterium]
MIGLLAALGVAAAVLLCAWVVATRLLSSAPGREQVLAAGVLACWGAYLVGRMLLAVHAFRWWVVLPLAAVAGVLAWRARPAPLPIPAMSRSFLLAAGAVAAILAARVLKGTVSPPLGWDAITYHLFKAGRFVTLGRSIHEAAPDGWGYYEFFPAAGSVLFGGTMLFARDGALLAAAGGAFGLLASLAVYTLARRLGASRPPAATAALAMAATPALASLLTTAYVDVLVAAGILAALALAPSREDGHRWARVALAGAACGLAAAGKTSAAPAAVALAAAIGLLAPGLAPAFVGVAAGTALPEYLGTWLRTGNPLYPFGLAVAGHPVLRGNVQLTTLLSGNSPNHDVSGYPWWEIFVWLGGTWRWPRSDFAGLGLGAALVAVLAAWGLACLLRDPARRRGALAPLLVAGVLVAAAWSPESVALRTLWSSVFGRHVLPIWGVLLALAALVPWSRSRFVFSAVVAAGAAMSIPLGWGRADARGAAILAGALVVGLALHRATRGRAGVLALLPLVLAVPPVREGARYEVWREAADPKGGPYDFHSLDPDAVSAWPMWKHLDGVAPSRIAATCGWNGVSQSWYLYPLLGSRLRHEVVYVPPTIDGTVVDYAMPEALDRKAQLRGYLRNLLARGVDRIVVLHPAPPEHVAWIVRLPEVFVPEWADAAHDNHLYRFDRERARAMVEAP